MLTETANNGSGEAPKNMKYCFHKHTTLVFGILRMWGDNISSFSQLSLFITASTMTTPKDCLKVFLWRAVVDIFQQWEAFLSLKFIFHSVTTAPVYRVDRASAPIYRSRSLAWPHHGQHTIACRIRHSTVMPLFFYQSAVK